jgi:hypothetical protein
LFLRSKSILTAALEPPRSACLALALALVAAQDHNHTFVCKSHMCVEGPTGGDFQACAGECAAMLPVKPAGSRQLCL